MRHSTSKPTKAHVARFNAMRRIGCICCRRLGHYSEPEVHHIVEGMRRLGHEYTLPLCPAHHRYKGGSLGPSIADGSKVFSARWGTQRELLAEVNSMIADQSNIS